MTVTDACGREFGPLPYLHMRMIRKTIHTYVHADRLLRIWVCVCVCVYVYMGVYVHVYTHIFEHMYICIYLYTYIYSFLYRYLNSYMLVGNADTVGLGLFM